MTALAICATSVPSERVFSAGGVTDTPLRNRLSPVTMEALQFLKFNYRHKILNFSPSPEEQLEDLSTVLPTEIDDDELTEEYHRAQGEI